MNKLIYKCLLYGAIGDKIGYNNGILQYNKEYEGIMSKENNPYDYIDLSSEACNQIVFNFLSNGLLEGEKLKINNIVSYNTILHIAISYGLLKTKSENLDEILKNIKQEIINYYDNDNLIKERNYSKIIVNQIKKLKKKQYNYKNEIYAKDAYSSDAATMTMILGVIFYQKKDFNKLIYLIINIIRMTHNNGLAILGGITSALFCVFIINKVNIQIWPKKLINILESEKFKKIYLENTNSDKEYLMDLELYIYQWKYYLELYFDENNNKKYDKFINIKPSLKYEYYFKRFSINKDIFYPGDSGIDCMIIVYDCLSDFKIRYKSSYDILLCYSVFHTGNSKNLGTIISSLYSLVLNYENIDIKLLGNNNILSEIEKVINLL